MTFTEAALEILKREGKPLHFKELTERAMTKKLLTFVGRTPEVTMQTQLTAAVKKAPGNPFVRVKPGVFGLLRYPELTPEERAKAKEKEEVAAPRAASSETGAARGEEKRRERTERRPAEAADDERGRRRRRRGGRGRGATKEGEPTTEAKDEASAQPATSRRQARPTDEPPVEDDEPTTVGLSPEARAAALAETGVLEGDDEMQSADDDADDDDLEDDGLADGGSPDSASAQSAAAGSAARSGDDDDDGPEGDGDGEGDDDGEGEAFGAAGGTTEGARAEGDEPGRRRRRRRRRRRGAGGEGDLATGGASPRAEGRGPDSGEAAQSGGDSGEAGAAAGDGESSPAAANDGGAGSDGAAAGQGARRIMAPADAAIEILRGQPPGRGVHVRQIADSAIRRRLIHGEPNEAWRVIRTSLAAEPKERLRSGMRPRVRSAGSGLYALARRPPDQELEKAEQVFGEARRALRERTLAALERRIAELPAGAFEALARVLLQREGLGPTTFVKRVEGTIYVEALRGRGSRPSKCLVALRHGSGAVGRRAIGELRAGIRARGQDEGLLLLAGRLADDAIAEWKQPGVPLEIADGAAMAETCARHGVGVVSAVVNVDFVDADFFAELSEG